MKLIPHLHLATRLRNSGATLLLHLYAFVAWTGTALPLAFYIGRNINLCSSVNAAIKLNRLSIISSCTQTSFYTQNVLLYLLVACRCRKMFNRLFFFPIHQQQCYNVVLCWLPRGIKMVYKARQSMYRSDGALGFLGGCDSQNQ